MVRMSETIAWARVLSRLTGRLITGPLGFLAAGLLDLASYWLAAIRRGDSSARTRKRASTIRRQ
jgi:hypothetical protein